MAVCTAEPDGAPAVVVWTGAGTVVVPPEEDPPEEDPPDEEEGLVVDVVDVVDVVAGR
jgi:hypothetical protein